MGRDNCDYHGQVYPFLDLPDDLVGGRSIEHHAVGALVLRLHRQPDSPGAGGDSAAHTHKDRHIGHSDNCLGNHRLRSEGVDGDDGIGIDVFNYGHVGCKSQGSDQPTKDADATALMNAGGQGQGVAAEGPGIGWNWLDHKASSLAAGGNNFKHHIISRLRPQAAAAYFYKSFTDLQTGIMNTA